MSRALHDVAQDIGSFRPESGDWRLLDPLIDEALSLAPAQEAVNLLLGVLERFPLEDGAGVLWSIVHGLEHIGGYEEQLSISVARAPSLMGITMLGRLLNADQQKIGDTSIVKLLLTIADDRRIDQHLRELAGELCADHRERP